MAMISHGVGGVKIDLRLGEDFLNKLTVAVEVHYPDADATLQLRIKPTLQKLGNCKFLGIALDQQDELHDIASSSFDRYSSPKVYFFSQ